MRSFFIVVSGLLLSAASMLGCGGGPCADYCAVSLECATATSCELADPGGAQNKCTNACEAGVDAVPDADGQKAVRDCLACIAPLYQNSCELTDQSFVSCQNECLPASNYIGVWVEAFGNELSGESILCTDGTPVGGGNCTMSNSGSGTTTSCSVECESGGTMVGAQCEGTDGTFTCQCTAGAQQGTSFSSDCDTLDSTTVWELCD